MFLCKVRCVRNCNLQWFVGNSSTRNQHQIDHYEARGFAFSSYQDNDLHTLRLTVNATLSNNNTALRCYAVLTTRGAASITSDIAILQIVLGMHLTIHYIILIVGHHLHSNQIFYEQIVGYQRGVGGHRAGQ